MNAADSFLKSIGSEPISDLAQQFDDVLSKAIKIKPSHEGLLRKKTKTKAGKNIPASKIEADTHSKDPKTRKQAIFAENAKKWNKGKGTVKKSLSVEGFEKAMVSRDPFARQALHSSAPIKGTCDNCGGSNSHGKVRTYQVQSDDDMRPSAGRGNVKGKFCGVDCMRSYHGVKKAITSAFEDALEKAINQIADGHASTATQHSNDTVAARQQFMKDSVGKSTLNPDEARRALAVVSEDPNYDNWPEATKGAIHSMCTMGTQEGKADLAAAQGEPLNALFAATTKVKEKHPELHKLVAVAVASHALHPDR